MSQDGKAERVETQLLPVCAVLKSRQKPWSSTKPPYRAPGNTETQEGRNIEFTHRSYSRSLPISQSNISSAIVLLTCVK